MDIHTLTFMFPLWMWCVQRSLIEVKEDVQEQQQITAKMQVPAQALFPSTPYGLCTSLSREQACLTR